MRKSIPPELNNCPVECPNAPRYYDAARVDYCDECPHKVERDAFRDELEQELAEVSGTGLKYKFDDCLRILYSLINVPETEVNNLSVKRAEMFNVYQGEKRRAEEIEEREREKNLPK